MNIGADGLKTGFTKEAGYGLVGSAVQNGLRLIVVVNGLRTEKERADEGKKLLEWGFHNFQSGLLFAEGQEIAQAKLYGGEKGHVPLVAAKAVRLMVPRGTREKIIARVVYTGPVRGAGEGRPEDRRAEGLAWRVHGAGDAAAGGCQRGHRLDAATRLRRRRRAGVRPVPRRLPEAVAERRIASSEWRIERRSVSVRSLLAIRYSPCREH